MVILHIGKRGGKKTTTLNIMLFFNGNLSDETCKYYQKMFNLINEVF